MRALVATLAACCALQGCKSQKLLAVERDLAATRARLDALALQKSEALAKAKERNTARWTLAQQADQTEQEQHRLTAALDVLGGGAVPKVLALADALATKGADVDGVAADIASEDLPCVAGEQPPAEGEADMPYGEPCHEVELQDACEGVPERTEAALTWSCEARVPGKGGGPDSAVCLASYHYPTEGLTVPAQFVATELDLTVVRVAFEHQGRLYVADYPAPSVAQYRPKNVSGLDGCAAENSNAQCVRRCESSAGRVQMTGACEGDGDWDGPHGDSDEPAEVSRAREEAERARLAAAEAETELAYQQCMSGCNPQPEPAPEAGPEGEPDQGPPVPPSVEFTWRASPAPGLYIFDKVAKEPQASWPATAVLLLHPKLGELLDGALEAPAADTLYALELQAELIDATATEPDHGKAAFIGLDNGDPAGVVFSSDGKGDVTSLSPSESCGWLKKAPRAAKALREACAKRGGQ